MIRCAFFTSWVYWLYLIVASQMLIAQDAQCYLQLGKAIHDQGWVPYFITGPNREPLYPFLICISMKMGEWLSLRWDSIEKIIQCVILLNTQILLQIALRKMNVHRYLIAFFILYIGVSPALVNATFSLYSEIASIIWPLAIVLLSSYCWMGISSFKKTQCFLIGWGMAVLFVCLTFVKGIFEPVSFVYMLIFGARAIQAYMSKSRKVFVNLAIVLLSYSFFYYGPVWGYKTLNQFYNKQFTVTNRGAITFYSTTEERTEPIEWSKVPAYLATIPGNEFCLSVFDAEKCQFWNTPRQDQIGRDALHTISLRHLTSNEENRELVRTALRNIQKSPVQYSVFTFLEACKLLFWESTHIGFVVYPSWLEHLFDSNLFAEGLPVLMGILMFCSFCFAFQTIKISMTKIFNTETSLVLFTIWLSIVFIVFLSMITCILKRYLLTLAPLGILLIAYFMNAVIIKYGKFKSN